MNRKGQPLALLGHFCLSAQRLLRNPIAGIESPRMPTPPSTNGTGGIFTAQDAKPARTLPIVPLAIAGAIVLILVAALAFFTRGNGRHTTNQVLPPDPRASSLAITDTKMSQSSNIAGGTSTYLDGHITNNLPVTVTAVTAQVIFRNDIALPPQVETTSVFLIRSRDPYVDTQSISAAPLAPGAGADFRLTFESLSSNWNQQMPEIRLIQITSK